MSQFLSFIPVLIGVCIAMGVLIFVHELGHYLTARLCHVTIHEFSIGMGKRIGGFTSKKTGIQYSFRLFPIGGYVAMAGEDEEVDDPNAFNKKNVWQRMLILVAGATMNVLTGFLAMLILTFGLNADGYMHPTTTVQQFTLGAPSQMSGLMEGDRILKVDGTRVHTGYDLSYEITFNAYQPVDLVVERNGKTILLSDVRFSSAEEEGITLGQMDFAVKSVEGDFPTLIKSTFWRSVSSIKMVFDSLGGLITGRIGISSMSGPLGVAGAVSDVAAQPLAGWNLLYLFALIAMNIGIMNLLPIPALDGGRLFFRIVEVLRFGKPINPNLEARIHGAGMMVLFLFMIIIFIKDAYMLF